MRKPKMVKLKFDLFEEDAAALAQLCKRFTFEDATRLSNRHDHGRECDGMLSAIFVLQRALAAAGFAPR